jgi:hypothetical protein
MSKKLWKQDDWTYKFWNLWTTTSGLGIEERWPFKGGTGGLAIRSPTVRAIGTPDSRRSSGPSILQEPNMTCWAGLTRVTLLKVVVGSRQSCPLQSWKHFAPLYQRVCVRPVNGASCGDKTDGFSHPMSCTLAFFLGSLVRQMALVCC